MTKFLTNKKKYENFEYSFQTNLIKYIFFVLTSLEPKVHRAFILNQFLKIPNLV